MGTPTFADNTHFNRRPMLSPRVILALRFVPGMTQRTLANVILSVKSLSQLRSLTDHRLGSLGVKATLRNKFQNLDPYYELADRQIGLAETHAVTLLTLGSRGYPESLAEIWRPPTILFVKGSFQPRDLSGIAMVGTRSCTMYGRLAAERYAERFGAYGVTVVSGLARGIDTWSHKGAMKSGGRTIAVVASGLDEIQPAAGRILADQVCETGCVLTEHPFGTKAIRAYFPQRNRIISGMTKGTVVVESGEKGGAMITARFALDQNREVFALPGPITSQKSAGTNELIRTDSARLSRTPDDVLESLGLKLTDGRSQIKTDVSVDLTLFERQTLDALESEPIHVDSLVQKTKMKSSEVLVTLLTLEFKGLVRQMAGKMFVRSQ